MMLHRRALFAAGALTAIAAGSRQLAAQQPSPAPAPASGQAPVPAYKHLMVSGGGDVPIATYEYGNPEGIPILLVHGIGQCNLSWEKQVSDPALTREFRLVTIDIRGHGMSGKPVGDEHYKPAAPWAADVNSVIRTLNLRRPVLVGWSYGGRLLSDYMTVHGTGDLGALNYVDAATSSDPAGFGPGAPLTSPNNYGSADLRTAIESSRKFLRVCFEKQPTQDEYETMVAFMNMVPRHVRLSAGGRPAQYEAVLKAIDVPTLVTQGEKDQLAAVPMGRYTAKTVPNARLSLYEGIGHAPFWEDAPRYNRELAELARSARR